MEILILQQQTFLSFLAQYMFSVLRHLHLFDYDIYIQYVYYVVLYISLAKRKLVY